MPRYRINNNPERSGTATFTVGQDPATIPEDYALYQNYPNPFNPETQIRYDLPEAAHVRIAIYNMRGERVVELLNRQFDAGKHQISWNGLDASGIPVASGLYICRLSTASFSDWKKMILIR